MTTESGIMIYVDWDFTVTWVIKTDPSNPGGPAAYPSLLWQGEENIPYHYDV